MNPSGSGLERGVNCPASYVLNQARNTGVESIKGNENHEGIEEGLVSGETDREVVRQAIEGAASIAVERAFALDVERETVRFIGDRVGRRYGPLGPNEIALTVDAVISRADGVWVWDWKSRKRVTPAVRNLQLRAGAVAVMKHMNLPIVNGGIGYLDNDETDITTVDAFDVPVFFADMRTMLENIGKARAVLSEGKTPEVHSGPWCDYCPAISYCPAHTRLAKTMLGQISEVEKQIAFMSPEDAGRAWVLLQQVYKLADKVDASLRLRARQDVVPLPNGKRLALIQKSRANFDKKKALDWIKERGGDPKEFEGRTHYEQVAEINITKESA